MYHALLPNTDYRDKGRGHDRRLALSVLHSSNIQSQWETMFLQILIWLIGEQMRYGKAEVANFDFKLHKLTKI